MAPIEDPRLARIAAVVGARKVTPAAVRVVDVPGTGPRRCSATSARSTRCSPSRRLLRARAIPADDLETLEARAARRRPRPRRAPARARPEAGEVGRSEAPRQEVAELERLLAHLDAGRRARGLAGRAARRARAADDQAAARRSRTGPAASTDKLEAELAELDPTTRRRRSARATSALDEVVRRLFDALDLISFFTAGDKETRAWTLRRGQDGARRRRDDPLRHRARFHPLRGDPLGRPRRRPARTRRPPARACSGSRARPTSSRTATC